MSNGGQCQCKVNPATQTLSCAGADCLEDPTKAGACAADAVQAAPKAAAAAPAAKVAGQMNDWLKLGAGPGSAAEPTAG